MISLSELLLTMSEINDHVIGIKDIKSLHRIITAKPLSDTTKNIKISIN